MKVIDVKSPAPKRFTAMIYGASRVGKSRFAATFPRPLFISDAVEGGYETIRNMNPDDFWEPGRYPEVHAVESAAEVIQEILKAPAWARDNGGSNTTLVIDSITFLADLVLNAMMQDPPRGRGGAPNTLAVYGDLGRYLKNNLIKAHMFPGNVVWLALDKLSEDGIGSIAVPGRASRELPAACDYVFYQRAYRPDPDEDVVYETRTRPWNNYIAGGRDEGRLPDPLPASTYRALAQAAGWLKPQVVPGQGGARRALPATRR